MRKSSATPQGQARSELHRGQAIKYAQLNNIQIQPAGDNAEQPLDQYSNALIQP